MCSLARAELSTAAADVRSMLLQLLCDGCAVHAAFEQAFAELQAQPEYQHLVQHHTGAPSSADGSSCSLADGVRGLQQGLESGAGCGLERILQVRVPRCQDRGVLHPLLSHSILFLAWLMGRAGICIAADDVLVAVAADAQSSQCCG